MASIDPAHSTAMIATDAGFDATFIGFAAHPEQPSTPPPRVEVAEVEPLHEPIRQFRDWMQQQFSATDIFVLDHEGEVVFDESRHGRLHFLARSVALAARRVGAFRGNVHVQISAGAFLEIIPVKSAHGDRVLGAVVPAPFDSATRAVVLDALAKLATTPAAR
jgi:hypothetical protein